MTRARSPDVFVLDTDDIRLHHFSHHARSFTLQPQPQGRGAGRSSGFYPETHAHSIPRGSTHSISIHGDYGDHTPPLAQNHTSFRCKKGDPTRLENYRPITLTNALHKLWTTCIVTLSTDYIEARKILSPEQEGFRADRSCSRTITHLSLCV